MDTRLKCQLKPSTLDAADMSNDGRTGGWLEADFGRKLPRSRAQHHSLKVAFAHASLYYCALDNMPAFYQRFKETAQKFPDNIALEIQRQQVVERVTFSELARMSE